MPSFQFPLAAQGPKFICAIAPGGAFDAAASEDGARLLHARFEARTEFLQSSDEAIGYYAGPAHRRRAALRDALTRDAGAILWTIRGGSGCAQILEGLDGMELNHRWVVGFSDITSLHIALHQRGWVTMHAANLVNVSLWSEQAVEELWQWLSGRRQRASFAGQCIQGGQATGPLIGGNLTVLASLCGTPWQPRFADRIVLLEDIAEAPYRLDRALHQLLLSGAFDGCRGVVLGQFTRCGTGDEVGPADGLAAILAPLKVPILAGLPLGHGNTSRPVPFGVQAILDASARCLEVRAWP